MLKAIDWNVVVLGRWNPSILTPAGIAKRMFRVPADTAVEVLLAIDVMMPPIVIHDDLRVVVGSQRLVIETIQCKYTKLDQARTLALRALESLPETPLSAAGVNIKYGFEEEDDSRTTIQELIRSQFDENVLDGHTIQKRVATLTVPLLDGRLNLTVSDDDKEDVRLLLNFEIIDSDVEKQREWLARPIQEFEEVVRTMLTTSLQLPADIIPND